MRVVIQRVSRASVTVGDESIAAIDAGLLVLLGVGHGDTEEDVLAIAEKVSGLRIFRDDEGKMNRSVGEVGGAILVVSQFTLLADVRRGRRPSFTDAADPEIAERLVESFVAAIAGEGIRVATGEFGAAMEVELVNDGPVTIPIESVRGRVL